MTSVTITTTISATTTVPVLPNTTPSLPATTKPAAAPILTLYQPEVNNLFVVVNGSATPGTDNEMISGISWEWGDGSKEVHTFPDSHIYSSPGKYEIRVTVHQSDGQSLSKNVSVIVNEPFPTFLPTTATPTFPITLPPTLPPTLQPSPYLSLFVTSVNHTRVTIDGETAPGAVNSSITRVHWDWGDGNQNDYLGFPVSHDYALPGTYTVLVTSVQSDGQSVTKHLDIDVKMPNTPIVTESPVTDQVRDTSKDLSILYYAGIFGGLIVVALGAVVLLRRGRFEQSHAKSLTRARESGGKLPDRERSGGYRGCKEKCVGMCTSPQVRGRERSDSLCEPAREGRDLGDTREDGG